MKPRRHRRHKAEIDLRTRYYYREGVLRLVPVSNSSIGVVGRVLVRVFRYSRTCRTFLVRDITGHTYWTAQLTQVRPEVAGRELYHTSYTLLMSCGMKDGDVVGYRTLGGFAYLRKVRHNHRRPDYEMFRGGVFNCNVPRGYNFCLGYADGGLGGVTADSEPVLYNNIQKQTL